MKNRNNPTRDDWKTPDCLYKPLHEEFNFDFDPCPIIEGAIPDDRNGLLTEWGQRNFVNPPYSRGVKEQFVRKALEESRKGKLCVLLLPVSTSTVLFHDFILPYANEIRFVKGRVSFIGVNTKGILVDGPKPMHDSMIVVFDGRTTKYGDKFKRFEQLAIIDKIDRIGRI